MSFSGLVALVSLTVPSSFPVRIDVIGQPPGWFLEKVGLERDDAGRVAMIRRCTGVNERATALRDASMCHDDAECEVYRPSAWETRGGGSFLCQPIVSSISKGYAELQSAALIECGHVSVYLTEPCEVRAVCRQTQCEFAPRYCGWLGWSCPSVHQFTFLYFSDYQRIRSSQLCRDPPP